MQPGGSQNNQTIWILLRKPPVMSSRKGKIYYNPAIYLQSNEGKTCCSALFGHVAREKCLPGSIDSRMPKQFVGTLRPEILRLP